MSLKLTVKTCLMDTETKAPNQKPWRKNRIVFYRAKSLYRAVQFPRGERNVGNAVSL